MKKEARMRKMKNKVNLDIIVHDEQWLQAVDFDAIKVAEELKDLAFGYVSVCDEAKKNIFSDSKSLAVTVCLSNDKEIHDLNKEFRNIDKATNVLSFANIDDDEFWDHINEDEVAELGDVILAFETLENEAKTKNISVYAHYCHLLVHGFLHLLGFDHQNDKEAEEMETLETDILAQFSIDDPYQEVEEA